MRVNVIQFLRPNGRQVSQTTEISDDAAEGYAAMKEAGGRLTAECIGPNVSLCIEKPGINDYLQEVVKNGPAVPEAIAKMLMEFDRAEYDAVEE